MPEMSPNAYAILGLLAARPWSAYELARHMKTSSNLRQIWPRAESKIYQAPKDLEAVGWATSQPEHTGRRKRTVYRITPEGRTALAAWLDEPAARPRFELEGALKVAYATAGTITQLRDHLEHDHERSKEEFIQLRAGLERLVEQGLTIPERAHTSALVAELGARIDKALWEWNEWARGVVADWDDLDIDDAKRDWADTIYRDLLGQLENEMAAD
jgi:DNA-binding PadR family transcriptional regulator